MLVAMAHAIGSVEEFQTLFNDLSSRTPRNFPAAETSGKSPFGSKECGEVVRVGDTAQVTTGEGT
jgi:hypothetical protein